MEISMEVHQRERKKERKKEQQKKLKTALPNDTVILLLAWIQRIIYQHTGATGCNAHLPQHSSLLPSYGIRNDATTNERIKKMCYINGKLFTHNE
jgi:hypothetical protein